MKQHIQYNFLKDGHFAELKKAELMEDKINQLGNIESYIGTFFSKEWVQKNVLNMNDAQIKEMQNQINKEMEQRLKMVELIYHQNQMV